MPVLEALTLGAPVICSGATSLPEVAGDAALLVDPLDVHSIAHAMQSLPAAREALKLAAPRQAQLFSWKESAAKLRAIYENVWQASRPAVL
jgi:glycosyltransferase involved in cell wall biosynthesis